MSLGAEDSAFDAGNPPDASEKAKYEKKNSPDLTSFAAFYSFLAQRTLLVLASVDPCVSAFHCNGFELCPSRPSYVNNNLLNVSELHRMCVGYGGLLVMAGMAFLLRLNLRFFDAFGAAI